MTKCQKHPTCGIFLKRGLFKDMKNYIPIGQTRKYKKIQIQIQSAQIQIQNSQIQHMTECQKDPTCGTFFKRGLFKDFIPMCQTHKYENIQKRWQTVKLSNHIMEYWTERGHNNAINVTLHPPRKLV